MIGYTKAMTPRQPTIGNRIAPPRFLAFCAIAIVGVPIAITRLGWSTGIMIGFDVAAAVFLLSVIPLLTKSDADAMRDSATRNAANRVVLLAITGATSIAILAAVVGELAAEGTPTPIEIGLVIGTLALSWLFANVIYALHYAHLFYSKGENSDDAAGLAFPKCDEPDYWDFIYFAFTLGMTFQTSDVGIEDRRLRRTATFHSLAAFVFNLGVVAFTINVLGGG